MAIQKKPFVSDKLAKRRKAATKARKIVFFIILAAIIAGGAYFTFANRFFIKGVEVVGAEAVSADEVHTATEGEIAGMRIIVPKRNIFFYPRNKMEEKLAADFPRLATIAIEIENKNLVVTVTEREPAYLWCGEHLPNTRQESFDTPCYFVDAKGFIFSLAPQFSDAVYTKIYTTLGANTGTGNNAAGEVVPFPTPIGQQAMSAAVLHNVEILAKEVTTAMFKPAAYSVTQDGDAIIFLYRDSNALPEIRYNPTHDPLIVAAGFKTAISSDPLKSKLSSSFGLLEYIDLRFPNKVFYKFTNEVATNDAGATEEKPE
jgi:hypothetical protein